MSKVLAGAAYLYIYFSSIYIGETFSAAEVSILTLFWPPAIKKVPILRLCAFCPLRRIVVPRPPPPWSGVFSVDVSIFPCLCIYKGGVCIISFYNFMFYIDKYIFFFGYMPPFSYIF